MTIEGGMPIVVAALHERPMGMQWAGDDFIYVGRADRPLLYDNLGLSQSLLTESD